MQKMTMHNAPIGVFDSGIGGLSILKALRQTMPAERFVYFADSAHNPYGVKTEDFVLQRSLAIVRELVDAHQIKALVVACNTATAAAVSTLRAQWPLLPIIGVEPALKTAALATRSGRVLVLATRGTLQSEKFTLLKEKLESEHAGLADNHRSALHFTCMPCDGLADQIEQLSRHGMDGQETPDLVAACATYMPANSSFHSKNDEKYVGFDTLVLGCTHYPLIREVFQALVGDAVTIVDNAQPVALRTMQLLKGVRAAVDQAGGVTWLSSADEAQLMQAAQFWGIDWDEARLGHAHVWFVKHSGITACDARPRQLPVTLSRQK